MTCRTSSPDPPEPHNSKATKHEDATHSSSNKNDGHPRATNESVRATCIFAFSAHLTRCPSGASGSKTIGGSTNRVKSQASGLPHGRPGNGVRRVAPDPGAIPAREARILLSRKAEQERTKFLKSQGRKQRKREGVGGGGGEEGAVLRRPVGGSHRIPKGLKRPLATTPPPAPPTPRPLTPPNGPTTTPTRAHAACHR